MIWRESENHAQSGTLRFPAFVPTHSRFAHSLTAKRKVSRLCCASTNPTHSSARDDKSCFIRVLCGFSLRPSRLNAFDFSYLLLGRISSPEHLHLSQMR